MGDGSALPRRVRRWLGFINSDLHKTFSLVFAPMRFLSEEGAQKELAANASKLLSKLFAQLDAQLAGKSYLVGADPSVADAYLYVVLTWAHGKQVDLTGLDNLAAFFKRMQENSGVKAARKAEGLECRARRPASEPAPGRRMMAACAAWAPRHAAPSFSEQSDTGGDALVRPARGTSRHARGRAAFRARRSTASES